jgi:hypothetical protein
MRNAKIQKKHLLSQGKLYVVQAFKQFELNIKFNIVPLLPNLISQIFRIKKTRFASIKFKCYFSMEC